MAGSALMVRVDMRDVGDMPPRIILYYGNVEESWVHLPWAGWRWSGRVRHGTVTADDRRAALERLLA